MGRIAAVFLLWGLMAGCHGPGRVEFTQGQCLIDGRTATLAEVEDRQARISERILDRQPWFVLITVLIVALAGMSHVEKVVLLFSTRGSQVRGVGERLRLMLERYRQHPVRYFSIVAGTLSLLGVAGGCYVYLDADKRASERALGLLQFCHLALRDTQAQGILSEQRRNLEALESTAGSIRTLVDKLPPEEQRKAREIVNDINSALARQGKLVGEFVAHTDESTRAVRAETEAVQRGLSSIESAVVALKTLPSSLHDLAGEVHLHDGKLGAVDGKLGGLDGRLGAVDGKLGGLDGKLGAVDGKLAAIKSQLEVLAARSDGKCVCDKPSQAAAADTQKH
jgi:hypothetical protein